jgi:hypothetical protein
MEAYLMHRLSRYFAIDDRIATLKKKEKKSRSISAQISFFFLLYQNEKRVEGNPGTQMEGTVTTNSKEWRRREEKKKW